MLHYNFSNYNPNTNLNSYILSSDAGETTSTDSDIGTSPSATTIASPPSSPQQLNNTQNLNTSQSNYDNTKSFTNYSTNNSNPSQAKNQGPNNSIIRQHSYLHAVQLNDFKIVQPQAQKNPNFTTINENEIGPFLSDPNNANEKLTMPYYYSPSSTVIRQQRILKKQQQQQQEQAFIIQNQKKQELISKNTSTPTTKFRSKSNMHSQQSYSTDGNLTQI